MEVDMFGTLGDASYILIPEWADEINNFGIQPHV